MQLVRFNNVFFKYEENKYVLNNVSFSFGEKGIIAILGKSGSGKSTLLSLLNGSLLPTKGEIIKDEKARISTSFQSSLLLNYLNVYENVALPLYLNGEREEDVEEKVHSALEQVEMKEKAKRDVKNLSGGEKMRVSLARALVNSSNIIILDEPTGALDEEKTKEIYSIIKKLSKKILIILVTHDEIGANEIADTLYELKEGKLNLIFKKDINDDNKIIISNQDNKCISYKKGILLNWKYLINHKIRVIVCLIFSSLSFSFQYIGMNIYFNIDRTLNSLLGKFYSSSTGYLSRVEQLETSKNLKLEKVSLPSKKDLEELNIKSVKNSLDFFIPQYQEISLNNLSMECRFIPVIEEDKSKLKNGGGILTPFSVVVNSLFLKTFNIDENQINKNIYYSNQVIIRDEKKEANDLCNIELTFVINGISKETSSFNEPIIYYSYDGIYQFLNTIKCNNISEVYSKEVTAKDMLDMNSNISCDINSRAFLISSKEIIDIKKEIEKKKLNLKISSKIIEIFDSTKELVLSVTRIAMVYIVLFIILASLLLFLSMYSLYEKNIRLFALVKIFSYNNKNNLIITFTNGIIFFALILGLIFVSSIFQTIIGNIIFRHLTLPSLIRIIDIKSFLIIVVLLSVITFITTLFSRIKIKNNRIKKELDGED